METLTELAEFINTEQPDNRGTIDNEALREVGMENDKERHKEKTIYLGSWVSGASSSSSSRGGGGVSSSSSGGASSSSISSRGTAIKVAISRVVDALKGKHTAEVSVSSPALNELLVQLQKAGNMDEAHEQQLRMHPANLMDFAQAAVRIMAA
jgi:hypothetical protein